MDVKDYFECLTDEEQKERHFILYVTEKEMMALILGLDIALSAPKTKFHRAFELLEKLKKQLNTFLTKTPVGR